MDKHHIAVLYREFLFRMVDRELLSAGSGGDINKFLGRLAAFLIWISVPFAVMASGAGRGPSLAPEHILISTTMLLVSVFCVLAWDSLFPDRRDIFVLTPLAVKPGSLFVAKIASLFAALAVAVALYNGLPGLVFPFALMPPDASILDLLFSARFYRNFVGYWATMFGAGAFILGCVICIQALTSLLPRPAALRLSSVLQIATFCTAVAAYFLQPSLATVGKLSDPANRELLQWLPSYWFVGLMHQLTGISGGPAQPALMSLAARAWAALAIIAAGASIAVVASFASLRRIAEQPDIIPAKHKPMAGLIPGSSPSAAIVQWTARTLLRSRQHRVLVTFYAGIGFAAVILYVQTPVADIMARASASDPWREISLPLIGASFVMTLCWIVGVRAAFAIPAELKANWIFQLALTSGPAEPLAAARTAFYTVAVAPVWCAVAIALLWMWPWITAIQHLVVLGLLAATIAAVCLRGFYKLPFACSYLPGVSNIHMTLALSAMFGLNILFFAASHERRALFEPRLYALIVGGLTAAFAASWKWLRSADTPRQLRFEEEPDPAVLTLGLNE